MLLRGCDLDPDLLRAHAERYQAIDGEYGTLCSPARDATVDELAQQAPLVRFEILTLIRVGALLSAGFRLEPTGRNPRHFTVAFDDLDGAWRPSEPASTAGGRTRTTKTELGGDPMDDLDLIADLNAQDDDGLGWSTLADAAAPELVRPGVMLLAGNSQAPAVVRIVAIDEDAQVHFAILPGSVAKNRHLLDRSAA